MEHNLEPIRNHFALKDRLTVMLALLGIASSIFIGIGLILKIDNLKGLGMLFAMAYILVLIWWLARSHPKATERPDFSPIIKLFNSYWIMLGLISILAVLAFILTGVVMGNGWIMFPLSTLPAVAILIAMRKQINRKVILAGIIVSVAFFSVEFIFQPNDAGGAVINALYIACQAWAGILLLNYTGLTKIQFYDGHILKALQSLCWGCVLAFPPALFNMALMTSNRLTELDPRFNQWWKAFYALQPGILEETWARLFLLTLFYVLLRPRSPQKPQRALTAALIISVFIHGLAHYPQSLSDPVSAIFIALMYGIPLGLIYIKRDYESAIAYHFFIDFVRFAFMVSLIK